MSESAKPFHGLLAIDKPAGLTSAGAVARVKRLLPRGTKVGHAGTLDSFATGLLVLLIGKATKQCERVMGQPKTYEATIRLGAVTETNDPDSPEQPFAACGVGEKQTALPTPSVANLSREPVERALRTFVGEVMQRPPAFSALKVQGMRAADRVRAGETILLPPRPVTIYSARLLDFDAPFARVVIECGRGTYIRAIARDLGELLGVGGYLTQLRRTRIGAIDVAGAPDPTSLSLPGVVENLRPLAV